MTTERRRIGDDRTITDKGRFDYKDFITGLDKASYGKVDSFRAANSDDYFLIRVIACVDSTLKILGYLFTESDQTCVCSIAGLAFFKSRDSFLTY